MSNCSDHRNCLDGYRFGIEVETVGVKWNHIDGYFHLNADSINHNINRKAVWRPRSAHGLCFEHDVWKSKNDSSLRYQGNKCAEIVSPVLRGENGLHYAIDVLNEINREFHIKVNKSCGLHVHFSWPNWKSWELLSLMIRYSNFEREIDEFMTYDRKQNANAYAKKISPVVDEVAFRSGCGQKLNMYHMTDFYCDDPMKLETKNLISGDRYDFMNDIVAGMESVRVPYQNSECTVEFRHHHGTLDIERIENWIRFLAGFITASRNKSRKNVNFGNRRYYRESNPRKFSEVRTFFENAGWKVVNERGSEKWTFIGPDDSNAATIDESAMMKFYDLGSIDSSCRSISNGISYEDMRGWEHNDMFPTCGLTDEFIKFYEKLTNEKWIRNFEYPFGDDDSVFDCVDEDVADYFRAASIEKVVRK